MLGLDAAQQRDHPIKELMQALASGGEGAIGLGPEVEHAEAIGEVDEGAPVGIAGPMLLERGLEFDRSAERRLDDLGRLTRPWQWARQQHVDAQRVGLEPIAEPLRLANA